MIAQHVGAQFPQDAQIVGRGAIAHPAIVFVNGHKRAEAIPGMSVAAPATADAVPGEGDRAEAGTADLELQI